MHSNAALYFPIAKISHCENCGENHSIFQAVNDTNIDEMRQV